MQQKNIKIYLLLLLLPCLLVLFMAFCAEPYCIQGSDGFSIIMLAAALPATGCLLLLLLCNGLKTFRLDAVGIVSGLVLALISQIWTFLVFKKEYEYEVSFFSREVLTHAVGALVAALTFLALHDTIKKQKKLEEAGGDDSSVNPVWRNLLYGSLLAALLVFVTVIMTYIFGYSVNASGVSINSARLLFLYLILWVAASALFLLFTWLWKHTKIIAILLAFVALPALLLPAAYYFDDEVYRNYYAEYDSYDSRYESPKEPYTDVVTEYVDEVYEDDEEYGYGEYEEEEIEDGEYVPEFIGDGIIGTESSEDQEYGDLDSIASAIHYLRKEFVLEDTDGPMEVPFGLFPHHYSRIDRYTEGYGSRAYNGIFKLFLKNKRSIGLVNLVGSYFSLLYNHLPYEAYRDNGYKKIVDQLIAAYSGLDNLQAVIDIMEDTELREEFNDASSWDEAYRVYFNVLYPHISAESLALFYTETSDDDEEPALNISRVVWLYSFWGRRYREGVAESLYDSLVKLSELYEAES
ncbi:hypothetical protein [Bacteroides sp. 224]|uniref:hypothetical protein n=1 Tax=Bacteroides sp. 224 TaxID=2302936 RepID=UPI0013D5C3F6|nr:hypothetical protein [Bacteroides sp. 224]NDV66285.1 hypothetical protein [Bacteroides sp. 224]